jgi:dihydroxyacetone kinase
MKKIINDPARLVDDMLDGVLAAHPGWVRRLDGEPRALVRVGAELRKKVGIATGGGSGHLPLFAGYRLPLAKCWP